jgi:hypothetical protein
MNATNGSYMRVQNNSGADIFRIKGDGNVGIGTTNPVTKFVVSNSGAEGVEFIPGAGGNINYTQHYNRSTSNWVDNRQYANTHSFHSGATEIARITGTGITFNGDTAAANALDDYEEGTHIATITPTGGSITVNSSVDELGYVKIGRQVTVTGMLTVGSVSSPTGYFNISLPFSIGSWASSYGNRCTGSIWVNPKTGGGNVADYIVYGIQGESQFRVYLGDTTSIQADSAQTLYNTVDIVLSITYITN